MSNPSLKARKDLLKVRATLERVELADNVIRVRASMSPSVLARSLLGGLRGPGSGGQPPRGGLAGAFAGGLGGLRALGIAVPGGLAASAPTLLWQAFRIFRQSPIKASVVGLAGLKVGKTAVKWGTLGYLGYRGFKLWQYVNNRPAARIRRINRQIPADVGYEAGVMTPPPPPARGNAPYR